MRKLATLVFGLVALVFVAAPASAGSSPDIYCSACKMFRQLQGQTPKYVPPSTPHVKKASTGGGGQTCFWVLNKKPTAVVLRKGRGNSGSGLLGWDASGWSSSSHYPGFVTKRVCFPTSKISGLSAVSLCGDVGWQSLAGGVLRKVVNAGSWPKSDPACIAGSRCPPHLR